METWRPVIGYLWIYEVSDLGRVRRCSTRRVLAPIHSRKGYCTVSLYHDGKLQTRRIHRLVLDAFVGPHPDLQVNHKNFDRADNRLGNLEWVTPRENALHSRKAGRYPPPSRKSHQGPRPWFRKLTDEQVEYVRTNRGWGTQVRLAKELGVSQSLISLIHRGKQRFA